MKTLSRYLLAQHAWPFVFALSALTSILLLNQVAKRLEDLLGKGLPWTVIVEFFALTIPFIIAMTLSMAVLVAVLYTFSRMAGDKEITAIRAGGVSLGQLMRPLLLAATAVALVAFLFGDQVLPRSNHRLRTLMSDIFRTKPTFSLKEHVINDVQAGRFALRAARIDPATYRMRDVTLYDLTNQDQRRIIYADSGQMGFAPNQEDLHLLLYDGSIHEYDRSDLKTFQHTAFGQNEILVRGVGSEFVRREEDDYRGDREMGICELEGVVRTARQDAWRSERRAETVRHNALRALAGLPALEADSVAPEFAPGWYCRALGAVALLAQPGQLAADQEGDTVAQQGAPIRAPPDSATAAIHDTARVARDGSQAPAVTRPVRPLRPVGRARTPETYQREVQIQRDRADAARVRAAVYRVEMHKKYAIPAACIAFVLVGVPIALRFPGGGVGLVAGASMVIFGLYYVGLIGGETLANRLIVPPFWAMWAPNVITAALGAWGLWAVRRQGTARGRPPRRQRRRW
jgi:lipopolysaccharide export system permease protein